MPAAACVRVFAPPEDRVRELFAGPSQQQHAADRKVQEQEKKKAYAAELQAQMQEQQMQRQQERVQRFGPRSGAQPAAPWGAAGTQAASANLQPALGDFSGIAAAAAAAGSAPLAASSSYEQGPQLTIALPAHLQHQHQTPQHQEPSWGSPRGPHGLMQEYAHGPSSLSSSSSPPPWMQHSLQQPNYGVASMLQQQHQQPYANWPIPQQQPGAWPGAPSTSAAMYQGPSPYTTTAVAPSFSSLASSYSPGGISPGRGFQAGASAAAAVAAMQAAAAARSVGPPLAEAHWGLAPPVAMSSEAPFTQQWPPYANSSKSPGALATLGGFSPTSSGGPAMRGAAESSNSSPPRGRGEQDRARKDAYRAELEAQIRERAAHKAAQKSQRVVEEARKDAEMAAYSPWGRGGAGAPLRDASGQVVTGLRGAANQQQQQQQQLQQWQQQHDQQQQQQQQQVLSTTTGFDAAGAAGSWQQQQHRGPEGGTLLGDPSRSSFAVQGFTQQQQQQQGSGGGAGGGVPGNGGAGPAPVLCFRSDKAFMTVGEIEAKQRQQKELQQELDRQVQEKRRQKELKRQQEEEDARLEEQRIAAEQAHLTAQFQDEQDSGRTRANRRSSRGGGAEGEQQGSMSAAGGRSTGGGSDLLTSKSEGRRRTSVLMAGDDPSPLKQQQSRQQLFGQELASQPSRGSLMLGPHSTAAEEQFHHQQQQQQYRQQLPPNMQQPSLLLDPQQRQQMLYEALQLEGRAGDQHANQELGRLRQDMESQAAALRSAVESQGREVAALRATAAAAEAESAAAKAELAQVKREMLHKSQELPHESLATMLADYGDGPASALMQAAFHPNPIRRIDLELPPSAAALRRSIEAQARAEVVAGAARGHAAAAGGLRSNNLLGSSGSAVDLLESLLQHGRGAAAASASAAAAAGGHGSGYGVGRSASMPAAGAEGGCPPGWLGSVPLGGAVNLRGSMLAAESTFIFPAGLQAPAAGGAGADEAELGASSSTAAEEGGDLGGDSTGVAPWDAWQQQQQVLPSRHITSAPGYLSSRAGMPLQPTLSRRGRDGLMTPGGSDLMAVVNRNADKLRVLQNMPDTGSTEALDQFLATFVAQSNQPKQATASGSATPVSRLMTPQVRTRPHRYSNTAADSLVAGPGAAAAVGVAARCSFKALPGAAAADTLDIELSKLDIHRAAALGHEAAAAAAAGSLAAGRSASSYSQAASTQAQQRLLLAGTAAGIGAAAAAAYGGSGRDGFDWAE